MFASGCDESFNDNIISYRVGQHRVSTEHIARGQFSKKKLGELHNFLDFVSIILPPH